MNEIWPPEQVKRVEKQFDLEIHSVELVTRKARDRVFKLCGRSRNVFLKLKLGPFSSERVGEEAALLEHLNDRGFKAPTLVRDVSGGSVLACTLDSAPAFGYLTEEVQIAAPGIDLDDKLQLGLAARRLAEFHTLSDALGGDFTTVCWDPPRLIDRSLQTLEPLFVERRRDFATLCRSFAQVEARISRAWKKTDGCYGIIHGDLHPTNVVVGTDGDVWLLDFESFGNGWRILDVAYLLANPLAVDAPLDLRRVGDRYRVFMDEYSRHGPHLAAAPELPVDGLAVRLLLQSGRQFEHLSGGRDLATSRRESWIDSLLANAHALTRDG